MAELPPFRFDDDFSQSSSTPAAPTACPSQWSASPASGQRWQSSSTPEGGAQPSAQSLDHSSQYSNPTVIPRMASSPSQPRQRVRLTPDDVLSMVQICVAHKSAYRSGNKLQFWKEVDQTLRQQTGKNFTNVRQKMTALVRERKEEIELQTTGTESSNTELSIATDDWIDVLDEAAAEEEAEKARKKQTRLDSAPSAAMRTALTLRGGPRLPPPGSDDDENGEDDDENAEIERAIDGDDLPDLGSLQATPRPRPARAHAAPQARPDLETTLRAARYGRETLPRAVSSSSLSSSASNASAASRVSRKRRRVGGGGRGSGAGGDDDVLAASIKQLVEYSINKDRSARDQITNMERLSAENRQQTQQLSDRIDRMLGLLAASGVGGGGRRNDDVPANVSNDVFSD